MNSATEDLLTPEQSKFFRARFAAMDSEELIDIHRKGGLLAGAEAILLEVLQSRGVSADERLKIGEELKANSYHEQFSHLAPIGTRFIARIVDGLIAFGVGAIGAMAFSLVDPSAGTVVGASLFLLYKLLGDTMPNGQSVGKRLNNIAVVSRKTGVACSPIQSIVRNLLLMMLGIVDVALLPFEGHRRIGDRLAGTIVIKHEALTHNEN